MYPSLEHINIDYAIIIGTDRFDGKGGSHLIDVRFPTALQIMLSLALAEQQSASRLSSSQLAESLGANPSFVRKLLVPLVQSKLLRSQMGKAGGVRLARPAAEITLRDIYRAVVADTKIWAPRTGIPHRCLVSSNVQGYFEELIDDAQEAILAMLGQRTLLQALTELEIRESTKRTTSKVRRSVRNNR
jgi:Rrf2 family transcriptional regulator, repressor of oqxAB